MAKKSKTNAQTANEEQSKVAGALEGDSNTEASQGADHGAPAGFSNGGYPGGDPQAE